MNSGLGYFESADSISGVCRTVSRSEQGQNQGQNQGQRSRSCEKNASRLSTYKLAKA